MDSLAPATGTALLLLVAFVLPGFVTLVARENTYVVREATEPFERLLLSLSYSVRIYGILILLAYAAGERAHDISAYYHGKRGLGAYILLGGWRSSCFRSCSANLGDGGGPQLAYARLL